MANEEKNPSPRKGDSPREGKCIVIEVPTGRKEGIEKLIHDALAQQPDDIFKSGTRELVIVLQHMGGREPK
jgi:hypothetical protein